MTDPTLPRDGADFINLSVESHENVDIELNDSRETRFNFSVRHNSYGI